MGEFSLHKLLEGKSFVQERYVESIGEYVPFKALSVKELNEVKLEAAKKVKKLQGRLDAKTIKILGRGGELQDLTYEELSDYMNAQTIEILRRSIADEDLTFEAVEKLPLTIFYELYEIAQEVSNISADGDKEVQDFREE